MNSVLTKILQKIRVESRYQIRRFGCGHRADEIPKSNFKRFLQDGSVIVEGGAHVGADTVELARRFPRCQIHAFEPVQAVYAQLKRNTRKFRNVTCWPLALSDRCGRFPMHISSGGGDGSSSLLAPKAHLVEYPDIEFASAAEVETVTVEQWASQLGIGTVDFMWLDVQGHEKEAIAGCRKMTEGIRAVHAEVNLTEAYEGAVTHADFTSWMLELGFVPIIERIPNGWNMGNVLYARNAAQG